MIKPALIRRTMGLTRTQMAAKADVTPRQIAHFELEVFDPSISVADRLAAAYCVTLNDILTYLRASWPKR